MVAKSATALFGTAASCSAVTFILVAPATMCALRGGKKVTGALSFESADAHRYVEEGHKKGSVVLTV